MVTRILNRSRIYPTCPVTNKSEIINNLIQSRNLHAVQTIEYDFNTVCSVDIDESCNFLIAGLSNGQVDLQGIQDATLGTLEPIGRFNFSPYNLHRVQWMPGDEQFFSMLDNHNLYLIDPVEMRVLETFDFALKTNWSEWNPSDKKMIAVCGSESQVRLVDISSGSSAQTIVLGAQSGLASHRATRCLWSRQDMSCLIVGDNEGYIHLYDTRHTTRPLILVGEERGQISGMSFTSNQNSIITSQGTENHLVQWYFDKCSLRPVINKFRKPEKIEDKDLMDVDEPRCGTSSTQQTNPRNHSNSSRRKSNPRQDQASSYDRRQTTRRLISLPVDAYLRCHFYVTDKHVFCPVPASVTKSKELYIYDVESGLRIKTIRSEDILRQGVYCVAGLLPDSLVVYVGGRGRLRVWSVDEAHQRKKDERMKQYHRTTWDSDEDR